MKYLLLSLLLPLLLLDSSRGTPAPAQFYSEQLIDHTRSCCSGHWTQRYYTFEEHFGGPGSPIFLILGGEGAVEPNAGLKYDFVTHVLAKSFRALVLQPEHRFYGASQPIDVNKINNNDDDDDDKPDPRIQLLTSEQALLDAIRLLHHVKKQFGCDEDGGPFTTTTRTRSSTYCPVITVGGSYPGFLSAMARLVYPDDIDIAYAASAPMNFYSQSVHQAAYYQHITQVADQALPGCAAAVKTTLQQVQEYYLQKDTEFVQEIGQIGICPDGLPSYIESAKTFVDEVVMMVGYTFANDNMAYYPPSNETRLYKACAIFLDDTETTSSSSSYLEKLRNFLVTSLTAVQGPRTKNKDCVDMRQQLPAGPRATISSGDWSGVGTGRDGESWDFQTCTLLVEAIGFDSTASMFPDRPWSLDWLQEHCRDRFAGVEPRPYELVQKWKWDDLVAEGASRILFTNGLNDGWSVSGILNNVSESILTVNFPNGAHHSDLIGRMPSKDVDTPDIWNGMHTIKHILKEWILEVQEEHKKKGVHQTKQKSLRGELAHTIAE